MKFIISIILLVLTVSVVSAQCHSGRTTVYTYPTTYQYPVKEVVVKENVLINNVIVPVAVPVLIPAFQFQYTPACAPAVPVQAVPVGVVPAAVPPVAASPVAAPQAKTRQHLSNEHIRELARALLAEMKVNSEEENEDEGPPVVSDGASPTRQLSWDSVLKNRCASCHTGSRSKAGVEIFTEDGQFNYGVDYQRVINAIESKRMPLDKDKRPFALSPQEVAAVKSKPR